MICFGSDSTQKYSNNVKFGFGLCSYFVFFLVFYLKWWISKYKKSKSNNLHVIYARFNFFSSYFFVKFLVVWLSINKRLFIDKSNLAISYRNLNNYTHLKISKTNLSSNRLILSTNKQNFFHWASTTRIPA